MFLHLFNNHSACDVAWCTFLKAAAETDPAKKKEIDNPLKYRNTTTKEEIKLMEKVREKVMPLLADQKMSEVNHPFHTQKNETLQ